MDLLLHIEGQRGGFMGKVVRLISLTLVTTFLMSLIAISLVDAGDYCDKFPNRCREKRYQNKSSGGGHYQNKTVDGRKAKTVREKCWDKNNDGWMNNAEIKKMNSTKKTCP